MIAMSEPQMAKSFAAQLVDALAKNRDGRGVPLASSEYPHGIPVTGKCDRRIRQPEKMRPSHFRPEK
jgi:hypothetical protein